MTDRCHYGNEHDLDYVLEKDGTDKIIGRPVAFIEVAWRRYTKHSRNKAQEIQGAILPLAEKYRWSSPFLGAILAGVFTEGSLDQLKSLGFQVLYFPYETLVSAFSSEGIDVRFDEATSDRDFQRSIKEIESALPMRMMRIKKYILCTNGERVDKFIASLNDRIDRMVDRVVVIPVYGDATEFCTICDAVRFLDQYQVHEAPSHFRKYEVVIDFSNGDRVEGSFQGKEQVREFLHFVGGRS